MQAKVNTKKYGDKELLIDSLCSQKFMTQCYNRYTNECIDPQLRSEFVSLLCEEHQIHADLLIEMKKRGYYQTETVEREKIMQLKKFFQEENKNIV